MTSVESGKLRQRSTLDLVKDLTHQASTLVHQEVELVKLEVRENVELAKVEMTEKGEDGRHWGGATHCRRCGRTSGSGGAQRVSHPRSRRSNAELGRSLVRRGDLGASQAAFWPCTGAERSTK